MKASFLEYYMNPNILPPVMDKIVGQFGLFNLGIVTSLWEGKLWIQTCLNFKRVWRSSIDAFSVCISV